MPCRIGTNERVARLLLGAVLAALGLWQVGGLLSGGAATAVGVVGMIFVVTGVLGCCPAKLLFRRPGDGQAGR